MNEHFDPLEEELAAFRPEPPSPQLKQRVAEQLAAPPSLTRPVGVDRAARRWAVAAAGGLVAACLAVLVLLPQGDEQPPRADLPLPPPQPLVTAAFDDAQPSVWTYRRAMLRSAGDLDDLFEQHASQAREAAPQFVQTRGFGRFDTSLETIPGDL